MWSKLEQLQVSADRSDLLWPPLWKEPWTEEGPHNRRGNYSIRTDTHAIVQMRESGGEGRVWISKERQKVLEQLMQNITVRLVSTSAINRNKMEASGRKWSLWLIYGSRVSQDSCMWFTHCWATWLYLCQVGPRTTVLVLSECRSWKLPYIQDITRFLIWPWWPVWQVQRNIFCIAVEIYSKMTNTGQEVKCI